MGTSRRSPLGKSPREPLHILGGDRAEIDAARADIGRRPADQRVIWTVEGPLTRRVNGIPSDVPVASHEVKAVRFIVRPSALSVPWVV